MRPPSVGDGRIHGEDAAEVARGAERRRREAAVDAEGGAGPERQRARRRRPGLAALVSGMPPRTTPTCEGAEPRMEIDANEPSGPRRRMWTLGSSSRMRGGVDRLPHRGVGRGARGVPAGRGAADGDREVPGGLGEAGRAAERAIAQMIAQGPEHGVPHGRRLATAPDLIDDARISSSVRMWSVALAFARMASTSSLDGSIFRCRSQ